MMLQLSRVFDKETQNVLGTLTSSGYYEVESVIDFTDRFKLSLHEPGSMPDLRADFINIKAGNSYEILVSPSVFKVHYFALTRSEMSRINDMILYQASEKLRGLDAKTRQCRFSDEMPFKSHLFKRSYWFANTRIETVVNL